jgi:hypothetical protein
VGLYEQVAKAIEKADAIAAKFDKTASSYTPTAKGPNVLQAISTGIAALTPDMAATQAFTPAGGMLKLLVANIGRWRYFTVEVANFGPGDHNRQPTKTPYTTDVTIEVSYPVDVTVDVTASGTTTTYRVADLKASDDEQIDKLLRNGSLLAAVGNATVIGLGAAFDVGDTVRRHRYAIRWERTW